MRPLRFLLALPVNSSTASVPELVSIPDEAIGEHAGLWIADGVRCLRLNEHGMVLGALFSRTHYRPLTRLEELHPDGWSAGKLARYLISNCWGAYVAIFSGEGGHGLSLLPDPSGLAPVYTVETSTHRLITSDPTLITAAVDFEALAMHLLRPELRSLRTCLAGVEELVPGSLTELQGTMPSSQALWQPPRWQTDEQAPTFEETSRQLRELSISVMKSLAGSFGHVAVAVSGGVDSSLVAAAMASGKTDFDCITVATSDPSGDERVYAHAVANALNTRCVERILDPGAFDPSECASLGLARPARRAFRTVYDRLIEMAREELGADVVFDGNSGDNLFCFLHSAAPIVDRLRAHGIDRRLCVTLLDMCGITGCSVPAMIAATIRRLRGAGPKDPWPPEANLLAPDLKISEPDPLTPWLENWTPRRSGALDHLRLLMHSQNHIHGITEGSRRFSPLACQPLVEFCLGVPTWVWSHGGLNRAPARAAFSFELPPSVYARTSKAGPDSFQRLAFAKNRALIRERLLDGLLAAHGLLDSSAVERALEVDEVTDQGQVERLMDLLEAENWARSWSC